MDGSRGSKPPLKPILLYDGGCPFCISGVERWRRRTGVEVLPVQGGAGEPYGFPAGQPMGAIHLIDADGTIRRGAEAIFRTMLLCGDRGGALLWGAYRRIGVFRKICDSAYAWVAARRARFSGTCPLPR